jgi:hypothetical protein
LCSDDGSAGGARAPLRRIDQGSEERRFTASSVVSGRPPAVGCGQEGSELPRPPRVRAAPEPPPSPPSPKRPAPPPTVQLQLIVRVLGESVSCVAAKTMQTRRPQKRHEGAGRYETIAPAGKRGGRREVRQCGRAAAGATPRSRTVRPAKRKSLALDGTVECNRSRREREIARGCANMRQNWRNRSDNCILRSGQVA